MTHITPERMDELWQQAFDDTHEGGTISHRFAALLFAEPAPVQPVPLTDVQKRPPNCGTGYCSCVECVMEPAAQPAPEPEEDLYDLAVKSDNGGQP